jgi:hypothetical protein
VRSRLPARLLRSNDADHDAEDTAERYLWIGGRARFDRAPRITRRTYSYAEDAPMPEPADFLAAEERTFVELIDDTLRATPGLHYDLRLFAPGDGADGAFARFAIATNPSYDLQVSIDLAPGDFRVRINGDVYALPLGTPKRMDRWIDRRCRDVDRLLKGDLRIEVETLFERYLSSGLFAGSGGRWVEIAERDDGWGWIGLAAWLLPFGLLPLRTSEIEYRRWFDVDGPADEPLTPCCESRPASP